jgi:putative transposase
MDGGHLRLHRAQPLLEIGHLGSECFEAPLARADRPPPFRRVARGRLEALLDFQRETDNSTGEQAMAPPFTRRCQASPSTLLQNLRALVGRRPRDLGTRLQANALSDGRSFRTFNVLGEGNREALAIEIGASMPSARVIRILDDCVRLSGRPARVRVDHGPELTAEAFVEWCTTQRMAIGYIEPGKPDQNAFIERCNRTFREEVLNAYLFDSLNQVRELTDAWLESYNTERPHDSLGQVLPLTFLPRPDAPAKSAFEVST